MSIIREEKNLKKTANFLLIFRVLVRLRSIQTRYERILRVKQSNFVVISVKSVRKSKHFNSNMIICHLKTYYLKQEPSSVRKTVELSNESKLRVLKRHGDVTNVTSESKTCL